MVGVLSRKAMCRPTDASEMAKRWFKSQDIGFPPRMQPLALGAAASRFCVPQENGAQKGDSKNVLPIC